jgi:protein gp37
MAFRLQAMGQERYENAFELTLQDDLVRLPLSWKKPRLIFVNSMSDLFHAKVPDDFIERCFHVMQEATQHMFQVLTKRPERVAAMSEQLPWRPNIWMGTSVENQTYTNRIEVLRRIPSVVRFLSVEPLLGPIQKLDLNGVHWVIVGGESGPGARPMRPEWVREVRDCCINAKVPFFFKQWGAYGHDGVRRSKKSNGRELDGEVWSEMPCPTLS